MHSVLNIFEKRSLNFDIPFTGIFPMFEHRKKTKGNFFFFQSFWTGSFVFFMLFCINPLVNGQADEQFSQNMFNPIVFNPGFAGSSGRINMVAMDRHQWLGFKGAPRQTVIGTDMGFRAFGNPAGVGLVIMNEEKGYYNNLTIQGTIARQFILEEGRLGMGVSVAIKNQVNDYSKAMTDPGGGSYHDPNDGSIPGREVNATPLDAGFGVWYTRSELYAGLSFLHLFQPKPNFNDEANVYIPRAFFLTAGYNHALWEAPIVLKPSFFLKRSGNISQLDVNMMLEYQERYWGGISYRIQDAIILMGGVELGSGVKIGYSYDITLSRLSKAGGGSHEIMVGYVFDLSFEKREKRYRSVRFL
jgi:type IX secretion system PorP/SprF family membrane protein